MKNKYIKSLIIFVVSAIVYLAGTLPLRDLLSVFTVTDVRPGAVINPFLSICFGPLAALGCTVSNFFADYLSGYPTKVLLQGLIPQFLYGFIPYILWKKLTKGDDHSYRLDSLSKLLKFTFVAFVYGVIAGICVGYIVQSNYGANFFNTAIFVFLNNFDMTMMFGCPLMIIANIIVSGKDKKEYRSLSTNEIIILYTSVIEIIGMGVIAYAVYAATIDGINDTYAIWNNIYIYSTIYFNVILIVSIGLLAIIENRIKKITYNK